MSLRCLFVSTSILFGCASQPRSYAPPLGTPDGPERLSSLEGSEPPLTLTCRGDLDDAAGEVCWTRAGSHIVSGERNVVVMPEEAIVRFRQLVAQIRNELGEPASIDSYVATPADTAPKYAAENCEVIAIRESMPTIPIDSREAAMAASERRLCLHAMWQTATEDVAVRLVAAVTSALDGPGEPGPGMAERYGLRLYRATRDPATRAAFERSKTSALESLQRSLNAVSPH